MNSQPERSRRDSIADRVYEGMSIVSAGEQPRRGVLGIFVCDGGSGELFGVVATHLMSKSVHVYDDSGKMLLGVGQSPTRHFRRDNIWHEYRSIIETLSLITIEPTLVVPPTSLPTAFGRVLDDPVKSLGTRVRRVRRDGSLALGILSSVEFPLALRSSTSGKVERYHGAMEVSWSESEQPFASFGDSGSIIYSHDGNLLGVVIAAVGRRCFAAPLGKFLEDRNLKIAMPNSLLAHNDRARAGTALALEEAFEKDWPVIAEFADLLSDEHR